MTAAVLLGADRRPLADWPATDGPAVVNIVRDSRAALLDDDAVCHQPLRCTANSCCREAL